MNCQRSDCTNEAAYAVFVEARVTKNGSKAIIGPFVHVCEAHSNIQWIDIIDSKGWALIQAEFQMHGFARPNKKFSNVALEKIGESL